ncbi:MAG: protein-disulfide reductase DsbD [[Actinobacillus] rossii]|nr:protein-disulfide reductase DsbD [[Actinobacillus] rossii]
MKKFFLFLSLFLTALSAQAGLFDNTKSEFLKADEAFLFSVEQRGNQLHLNWHIADGYYLYKKEISVVAEKGKVGELQFPPGEMHQDEFFGNVEIFRDELNVNATLENAIADDKITVTYQGCTTGFCYPPEEKIVDLSAVKKIQENSTALNSQQDQLAQSLKQSKYSVFWFFLLGLGLAFTPCVLPMLPLLSAVVLGQGERPSMVRALGLSFVYVQGMAFTYTLLGLLVVSLGLPFQIALQSPEVLMSLSVLFIILAASMFGAFELKLPNALQNKLNQWSQSQKSGAWGGVFVMGMIAGLVASPCTTAPLSGALLYVAQSGDFFTGAMTLYLLALGMGLPLMLVTLFGNKILPKSGAWMIIVKELFGFILLILPVVLLERVFPTYSAQLWVLWLLAFCCWVASKKYWVGLVVTFTLFFALQHYANSLQLFEKSAVENREVSANHTPFIRISTYGELQQALADNPKSIAMLDLYADWCVACKEFEKYTFSTPTVQKAFEKVLLLQVDMTKNSPENKILMEKLNVMGLPTIIFFNQRGEEIQGARITGFMESQPFTDWVNGLTN